MEVSSIGYRLKKKKKKFDHPVITTNNKHLFHSEYLAPEANCPINIDSKSYETTKKNMEKPDRWTFEEAAVS